MQKLPKAIKILTLSSYFFVITACSGFRLEDSSSLESLGSEISEPSSQPDRKELQKESEAVRRFLMSELLLGQEQDDAALQSLEVSQSLLAQPDFQIQLNLAQMYLSQSKPKEALKALKGFDSNSDLLRLKAGLLVATGKVDQALLTYQILNKQQADDTEALLFLAYADFKNSMYPEARSKLESLLKIDSRHLPAIKLLSRIHLEQKDYQNAYQQAAFYRSLDLADENVLRTYLISAYQLARYSDLSTELQKESKIRPSSSLVKILHNADLGPSNSVALNEIFNSINQQLQNSGSYHELRMETARLSLLRQDFLNACTDLQLLLIGNPEDSEVRYSLALALSSSGKTKAAQAELNKISYRDPWYVRAQGFLAVLYRQDGDLESVRSSIEKALKKEPTNDSLKTALASVLTELGDLREAKKLYESELEKDPSNQALLFSYAALLFDMNEQSQSMQLMQKIIQINPQHAEALNFLAYSLAEQGNELQRALDLSERSIQLQPENAFFLDTRGWILFKMEKFPESLEELQKALKLSNLDSEIAEHLGDVYSKLNRKSEARQSYTTAVDRLVDSRLEKDISALTRLREKIKSLN